jgi:HK97 family phage prohead protease
MDNYTRNNLAKMPGGGKMLRTVEEATGPRRREYEQILSSGGLPMDLFEQLSPSEQAAISGLPPVAASETGLSNGVRAYFHRPPPGSVVNSVDGLCLSWWSSLWYPAGPSYFTPGAFADCLARCNRRPGADDHGPVLTINHDHSRAFAGMTDGSMEIRETDEGLTFRAFLSDEGNGREARNLLETNQITGGSFDYNVRTSRTVNLDGLDHLEISAADLIEISLVAAPLSPRGRNTRAYLSQTRI